MGSPILYYPGAEGTAVAKWLPQHPTGARQVPDAPRERGMFVPFPQGKGVEPPMGLFLSVLAILPAQTRGPPFQAV